MSRPKIRMTPIVGCSWRISLWIDSARRNAPIAKSATAPAKNATDVAR
jgi:hypothetical protein